MTNCKAATAVQKITVHSAADTVRPAVQAICNALRYLQKKSMHKARAAGARRWHKNDGLAVITSK